VNGLSREALQVLELMPQWRRREAYAPARRADEAQRSGVLLVAVVSGAASQRLWTGITAWLEQSGCPLGLVRQALVLESETVDRLVHALAERRPVAVWSFSSTLLAGLRATAPDALEDVHVMEFPDLAAMLRQSEAKAKTWSTVVALKQSQWECFSTPISDSRS